MRTRLFFSLSLCCAVVACASSKGTTPRADDKAANASAIIVKGSDLSGGVLQGLRNRIPGMRVGTSSSGRCPRILLRSEHSIVNSRDPSIYVDGTRMADTCSLLDIAPNDVDHVEVYLSGLTPYPQIERNPFGLILIFRRRE